MHSDQENELRIKGEPLIKVPRNEKVLNYERDVTRVYAIFRVRVIPRVRFLIYRC